MTSLFDQRRQRLIERADEILQRIDRLLGMPEPKRDDGLDDSDLNTAKRHVTELRDRLISARLPDKPDRYASMSRVIIDQWPFGTSLGNAISELETDYQAL